MSLARPTRALLNGITALWTAHATPAPLVPPARALPVLSAGSPELSTAHLRPRGDRVTYVAADSGTSGERVVATGRQTVAEVSDPRGPALRLVTDVAFSGRRLVDTAVVLRAGLVPRWESWRLDSLHTRFDYDGGRVRVARSGTPDSVPRVHAYGVAVFHFNQLDALLTALPLRHGYEAVVPLYSEATDILEMDTVRIVGPSRAGVWTVRFADPAIVATAEVDGRTRRMLAYSSVSRARGGVTRRRWTPLQ